MKREKGRDMERIMKTGTIAVSTVAAAGLAFVIPLIGIVAILAVGDIYMEESVTALLILIFLVIYFVLIKLCNPRF